MNRPLLSIIEGVLLGSALVLLYRGMLALALLQGVLAVLLHLVKRQTTAPRSELFGQIVGNSDEAVLLTDRHGSIEYVNDAFCRITGYSAGEAIGQTPALLKSEAQDPAYYRQLWQTVTRGEVWRGTLIDRKKDGTFYPARMVVSPLRNERGEITHFAAIQQDISDLRQTEDALLRIQRLDSLGTLLSGIAHDFNNMISAIKGNLFLVRKGIDQAAPGATYLDNIDQLATRSSELIRQLLTYARSEGVTLRALPLHTFIRESLRLLQAGIPENIRLHCEFPNSESFVRANPTQLQQLLINLLINARDAVADCSDPQIVVAVQHDTDLPTPVCRISIRDNGCGISTTLQERIFEPFFTTKPTGKGTGLGLAMAKKCMQEHDGSIELSSQPEVGTTISLLLPLLAEMPISEEMSTLTAVQGNGETILLVEDNRDLREILESALTSLNYRVLCAENGEQGLAMAQRYARLFNLALIDAVMPAMGGGQLASALAAMEPSIPTIVMSGYELDEESLGFSVLNKPFSLEQLSYRVRSTIDAR